MISKRPAGMLLQQNEDYSGSLSSLAIDLLQKFLSYLSSNFQCTNDYQCHLILSWIFIQQVDYISRKSLSKILRRFSAMSIWFWSSPRSVVSALSIFHDRFSISASN